MGMGISIDRSKKAGEGRYSWGDKSKSSEPTSEPQPTETEERLGQVEEAGEGFAASQQEDITGQEEVNRLNKERADLMAIGMRAGQGGAMGKFDTADTSAQVGLQDVQTQIDATREQVDKIPEAVQEGFDRQQDRLSYGINAARTGLGVQRTEALTSVVQGQGQAMDAAVASIHGATRQQMSDIDAQVQQGTLSPSQAQTMKSQIKMGGAMQLSAAVGQTIHMFKETEAQVASSFGEMFTSFESTAAGVQGQFGATAAGAFGAATTAAAEINVELDKVSAGAIAHRDVMLSQNATSRAAAQSMNDQNNIAMMDYTENQYVMSSTAAFNDYQVQRDLFSDWVKTDQGQQMLDNMRDAQRTSDTQGFLGVLGAFAEAFS